MRLQFGAGSTCPDEGPGRLRRLWVGHLPPNIPFHPTGTVPSPAAAVGHSAQSPLVTFPCYERVSQPTNRSKIMKEEEEAWLLAGHQKVTSNKNGSTLEA